MVQEIHRVGRKSWWEDALAAAGGGAGHQFCGRSWMWVKTNHPGRWYLSLTPDWNGKLPQEGC